MKTRETILYIITGLIIVYCLFAFGSWDMNAGNWNELTRTFCALCMFFVVFVLLLISITDRKP